MEEESFEDESVARLLNDNFVSIKVDREERPDIDNIYMRVCQAFTGSGGWPTSIFMTSAQKPFYAGTYFPKSGFKQLLRAIIERWNGNRSKLTDAGNEITSMLSRVTEQPKSEAHNPPIDKAVAYFKRSFDREYGGFGQAPKFPTPHNLMLLIKKAPDLAEKTLVQMYKGGIFDHIGYGFSRYSTDRFWLVPHFEKMLYDNALLTIAYLLAYEETGAELYRSTAEKTLLYVSRELENPEGGFLSAQDADSDGDEGKYYVFTPEELIKLLGEKDGNRVNDYFGITKKGNFEGKNIPNLIERDEFDSSIDALLPKVYEYRKTRTLLRTDHKILTSWNALTIAAFANAYRILGKKEYLNTALKAIDFIEEKLTEGDTVYSSITDGRVGSVGFIDDYAFYIFALICTHQATQDERYLIRALELTEKTISDYFDGENGGFYFSGRNNEKLIFNPKESYDGAMPSGNSVMAYNLSRLAALSKSDELYATQKKQEEFMNAEAAGHPAGNAFYLYSRIPFKEIVCVPENREDVRKIKIKSDWVFKISDEADYTMLNGKTTYYVCTEGACLPPSNEPPL